MKDTNDIKQIHARFSTENSWNCAGECAYLRTRLEAVINQNKEFVKYARHLDGFRCDRVLWSNEGEGHFYETDDLSVKCTCGLTDLINGAYSK